MNNFYNKIYKFMYGRYGIDELYKFSFKLYIILFILNIFINSKIINTLEWILIITMIYRSFSKQTTKRKKENDKYLKIKKKIIKPFTDKKKLIKDKNHIYKKCHHCKTILRLPLPSKRGIKHSKCPTCKKRNTFLILRKLKIEIIKNKKM